MIEDPKLTLKILEYFARDDVTFPANVLVGDLASEFPDVDGSRFEYHVVCAIDNDLLIGRFTYTETFDRVHLTLGYLSGLTPRGGNYVKDSRTGLWDRAVERIKSTGAEATTDRIIALLHKLVADVLGITD